VLAVSPVAQPSGHHNHQSQQRSLLADRHALKHPGASRLR
jgi:hypothetical protein